MNTMNTFSTASRSYAHLSLPIRTFSSRHLQSSIHPQQQLRQLTTSPSKKAQPIQLASTVGDSELSLSSSDSIPSDTLSRAPTDSEPSNKSPFLLLGTVSRTGTMTSTIQLTTSKQTFDPFLQKHYTRPHRLLAHDPHPAGFLREGDVVEYGLFSAEEKALREDKRKTLEDRLVEKGVIRLKTRKGKDRKLSDVGVKRKTGRWVVRRVVSPFGVPVEERVGGS